MEDVKEVKQAISEDVVKKIGSFTKDEISEKSRLIQERLFDFANFIESSVVMIYPSKKDEVDTGRVISHCFARKKIVVVPFNAPGVKDTRLFKLNNPKGDFVTGPGGVILPDPRRCRVVPIESIDIAIIPGLVFDEKGARIGLGTGFYDRLIPKLPITTRKVSLAFEDQIIPQLPKGSIDRYVDIIITEKRIIYKI